MTFLAMHLHKLSDISPCCSTPADASLIANYTFSNAVMWRLTFSWQERKWSRNAAVVM